jgi:hypothetical protein
VRNKRNTRKEGRKENEDGVVKKRAARFERKRKKNAFVWRQCCSTPRQLEFCRMG